MNEKQNRQGFGFQDAKKRTRTRRDPIPQGGDNTTKQTSSRADSGVKSIPVRLVSSEELGSNSQNPYDRLLPQERYARLVALLARIYRSVKEEDTQGKGARPAA